MVVHLAESRHLLLSHMHTEHLIHNNMTIGEQILHLLFELFVHHPSIRIHNAEYFLLYKT